MSLYGDERRFRRLWGRFFCQQELERENFNKNKYLIRLEKNAEGAFCGDAPQGSGLFENR